MTFPLLSIHHLSYSYPLAQKERLSSPALSDISFSILLGQSLGLLGETGSGKSTLALCLVNKLSPISGDIFFYNKKISSFSREEKKFYKRNIQIVFQDSFGSLNPQRQIFSLLKEPFMIHPESSLEKDKEEKIFSLLKEFHLPLDILKRYSFQLSGGECQRLCIIRALLLNPQCIIFDESFSAIDIPLSYEIIQFLKKIKKKRQITYVIISHDLNIIEAIADTQLTLHQGKLISAEKTLLKSGNPSSQMN